jgi:hypothetical protein
MEATPAGFPRREFLGGVSALTLLALASACTSGSTPSSPTSSGASPNSSIAAMVLLLRAVQASPDHLTARAAELVDAGDADAIVRFVRDHISMIPPPINTPVSSGRWSTAATLRAGAGTQRDRVDLLVALLSAAGFTASAAIAARPAEYTAEVLYQHRVTPFTPDQQLVEQALAAAKAAGVPTPDVTAHATAPSLDAEVTSLAKSLISALPTDAAPQIRNRPDLLPDRLPLVSYQVDGVQRASFAIGDAEPISGLPEDTQPLDSFGPLGQVSVTVQAMFNPPPGSRTPATSLVNLASGTWPLDQVLGRPISLTFDAVSDPDTALTRGVGAVPLRKPSLRPQAAMSAPDIAPVTATLPVPDQGKAAHGTALTLWGDIDEGATDKVVVPGPAGAMVELSPAELSAVRQRVSAVHVRADASAFPVVQLAVQVEDGASASLDGLDAASFKVTEDGAPMIAALTANGPDTRRSRVLVVCDGSGSVSDTYGSPEEAAAFNATVASSIVTAATKHPFDVQVISLGSTAHQSNWSAPNQAELAKNLQVFSPSSLWSTLAEAGTSSGANVVILISDNVTTEKADQVATHQRVVGGRRIPVICLPVGTPDEAVTQQIIDLTGGSRVDPLAANAGAQLGAALSTHLSALTETTYRLRYTAPISGEPSRHVLVAVGSPSSTGEASGPASSAEYQSPSEADRLVPPSVIGVYVTIDTGEQRNFRHLGGVPMQNEYGSPARPMTRADAAEASSVLNGLTTILIEPNVPTPAAALDDILTAHLSWEPLRPVLASPTVTDLMEVAAGVRRYPTPFIALFSAAAGSGGGPTTSRTSWRPMTTVVTCQRPNPTVTDSTLSATSETTTPTSGAEQRDSVLLDMDISPQLNAVIPTASDPGAALADALNESLLLQAGEGLFPGSAYARLLGKPLTAVAPGVSLPPDELLASLDPVAAEMFTQTMRTYVSYYRLLPTGGAPDAFWVVDPPTGTATAILPDGSGGVCTTVDCQQLIQALNLALLLTGLGCTLGGADAVGGPAFYMSCVGLTVAAIATTAAGLFPPFGGVNEMTPYGVMSTLLGATLLGSKAPPLGGRIGLSLVVVILGILSMEQFDQ